MKLKTAWMAILLPFCVGLLGALISSGMKRFVFASRLTEIETLAKAYSSAQSAYYEEWGRFATQDENAGFRIESAGRFHFFTSADDLNDALRNRLPSHALPFIKKETFQILFVDEPPRHFWVADKTGDLIFSGDLK